MPGSCGQRMYADTLMGIARRKEGNRASTNHDGGEVLRMSVTGCPPNFGAGMPQRHDRRYCGSPVPHNPGTRRASAPDCQLIDSRRETAR